MLVLPYFQDQPNIRHGIFVFYAVLKLWRINVKTELKNRHHVFLTSVEGEKQKCIGCHIFTSKKYSGPVSYICPYTIS